MEDRLGGNSALKTEHGLSFFIETPGGRILFDTGSTGMFLENAPLTGIDPFSADLLVLSHGHYDHSGGVLPFYREFEEHAPEPGAKPPLWCGEGFSTPKYSSSDIEGLYYYNGNPFSWHQVSYFWVDIHELGEKEDDDENSSSMAAASSPPSPGTSPEPFPEGPSFIRKEILPGVHLVSGFSRSVEGDVVTPRFMISDPSSPSGFSRDRFNDEVSLVIETGRGGELMMIVGCSHPGIANMVASVAESFGRGPSVLLGGSHLLRADKKRLAKVISTFQELGLRWIGLNHCTGKETEKYLGEALPGFFPLRCGASFVYPLEGA